MKRLLLLCIALWGVHGAMGQEKCASHIYEQQLREKYPEIYRTKEEFENWMAQKIAERRAGITQRSGPYTIPVIIHIIYDNNSWQILNNTRNITYAQAESQIRVLNRDFNQTNLDFSTVVRTIFQPKAASLNITFVPATRDPNGNFLTEPGVERINGEARFNISKWDGPGTSSNTENILKPQTIWDPTKYLNIWVVEFQGSGLFGYAAFPPYTSLPGNPGGATSTTDGVVITWRAFGSNVDPDTNTPVSPPFVSGSNLLCSNCDRGRTTTHELGHWLGLRHIWGDVSGCGNPNSDDYCNDTPDQSGPTAIGACTNNNTCSTLEPSYGNTDVVDQRENYMDYSSDACMGMFSQDQVARMEIIMDNSPQRTSLTTPANLAAVAPTRPTGLYTTIYPEKTQI
ncbi:MAG: zinc metalloprotease [Raineya sp.]|nr:zinc metalloprotease [Raineya sp.]